MGEEESFEPKDIPKARHRERKYVKRRDVSRFDTGAILRGGFGHSSSGIYYFFYLLIFFK